MTDTRHIAGIYDLLLCIPSIEIWGRTVEIVQRLHPERIIDVCCGTWLQMKMHASLDCMAVGIDLSPGMVSAAKRRRPRDGEKDSPGKNITSISGIISGTGA